jgi:hypothetical protein
MNTGINCKGIAQRAKNVKISEKATRYLINSICPICNHPFNESDFIRGDLSDDPKALFIAKFIAHYRMRHIKSWDQDWGKNGKADKEHLFNDYEEKKQKVNERVKRKIIRKTHSLLIALGITSSTFRKLQNTDVKTIALAEKKLDSFQRSLITVDSAFEQFLDERTNQRTAVKKQIKTKAMNLYECK